MNRVTDRTKRIEAVLRLDEMWRQPLPDGEQHAPALSERGMVERLLALASSGTALDAMPHAWALQEMQEVTAAVAVQVVDHALFDAKQLNATCERLADDLETMRTTGAASTRLLKHIERTGWRLVLVPRLSFRNESLAVDYRLIPVDLDAAISYALALLLDDTRPYRAKLCRCDLSSCRRFFLAPPSMPEKGGKPLTTACCKEHKALADREKAFERVRRWREASAQIRALRTDGCSEREIADKLGLSQKRVRGVLTRIRKSK